MDVDWSTYGWLIAVVVVASACQNLTGFAFGLIFVGMAGALHLMPIADAPMGVSCQVEGVVIHQEIQFRPRKQFIAQIQDASGSVLFLRTGMRARKKEKGVYLE